MKKTTEINPERSERYRYLETFRFLPILIILCSITVIASILSWFRADKAIIAANEANAMATTWQTMYKETERECRLAQLEIDDFKMTMVKAGFNVEHEGESP